MNLKIEIKKESQIPVYKQIIHFIQELITSGKYKKGDFLPSMHELSDELEISKETVKKAYYILRDKGMIKSVQGKGFYITDNEDKRNKILVLFDKISTYKQVLFKSFADTIGNTADISINLHNQDVTLFERFIDENLDKFDYFLITPHFSLLPDIQKRAVKAIKKIPNRKLLLVDRYIKELPGNYGAVFQDFEQDVYDGLSQGIDVLKKFNILNVITMPGSMYGSLIEKGIHKFCVENDINYRIYKNFDPGIIHKQEAYLILNSQLDVELIELIKIAKMKSCIIGKDIGIISYNESLINQIILDGLTVISTDFNQMGELAAKMILEKSFSKIRCDFNLIRRGTF
jgi:DNA-binding transcriptional regulator YhcF (GntR family)